jgi:hypothetical protein
MNDVEIKARCRQFVGGSVRELLDCRQTTHGNFADNARIAQALKLVFRSAPNWSALTDVQREALEMLSGKLARFLSGDSSHADHIDDAIGYLTLIARAAQ